MSELEEALKGQIIAWLNLEDITPSDIDSEEDLFGNTGLGLDSIDALEIGVELQKSYSIQIDPDDENLKLHFRNVKALASFISSAKRG